MESGFTITSKDFNIAAAPDKMTPAGANTITAACDDCG